MELAWRDLHVPSLSVFTLSVATVLGCSHRSDAHAYLMLCSHRLFAIYTSWARGEGLAMSPSSSLLPPISFQVRLFGSDLLVNNSSSMARLDAAMLQWCLHLLGCLSSSPSASVLYDLGFLDSVRILHGHALAFLGRVNGISSCGRDPLPAAVFDIARRTPDSGAHWCLTVLEHHGIGDPSSSSIGPRCSAASSHRWLRREISPVIVGVRHSRLTRAPSLLTPIRFHSRRQLLSFFPLLMRFFALAMLTATTLAGGSLLVVATIQAQVAAQLAAGAIPPHVRFACAPLVTCTTACFHCLAFADLLRCKFMSKFGQLIL